MAKPILTEIDFQRAAKKLRCEVAAVKAVAEVESRGKGFYASGFPVILFEKHIFRKYTQGRYNKSHPHLSGDAGGYGAAGQNQINKFNEAFGLNPTAAMKACSWGKFQIMGFNHEVCGYEDVGSFVDAMKESEGKQLDAFIEFVIGNGLGIHLRTKNWAAFAKGYNGAGYRKNNYDTKMASAYKRHSGLSQSPAVTTASETSPTDEPQNSEAPTNIEGTIETTKIDGQAVIEKTTDTPGTVELSPQEDYKGIGLFAVLKKDFTAVGGGNLSFQSLQAYAEQASGWPPWVISLITKIATIAIILGGAWLLFRFVHYAIWKIGGFLREKTQATINADPNMKDLKYVK